MVFRCRTETGCMQKSSVLLVIMGGLVAGGMALSVLGNEVLFEDFAKNEGRIGTGDRLEVQVPMEQSESGVFAVEVLELRQDTIYAAISDPSGNQILREAVDREAYEGYFDVSMSGNYTLMVDNSDREEKLIAGYIGPEPDASKRTIAFVSIYMLVIGLVGMLAAVVFAIVAKRRR